MINFIIVLAIIVAIYMFYKSNYKESVWITIVSTIGVLGTFIGIYIGLRHFNTDDITGSVPSLLEGMKTAFITSIAGMMASILMKIVQRKKINEEEENVDDIVELFNLLVKETRETNKTLISNQQKTDEIILNMKNSWSEGQNLLKDEINELNKSLTSKEDELIGEFRIFANQMAENNSKALIEALNDVVRDFNNNLTEQFGENFKELNKAVESLLVWQENYKEIIENTNNYLNETFKGIKDVEASIKNISESTELIKDNNEALNSVLEKVSNSQLSIESGIQSIANIAEKAEASVPVIEEYYINSIENVNKVSSEAINVLAQSNEKIKNDMVYNNEKFKQEIESYINDFELLVNNLNNCIPNINDEINKATKNFNDTLIRFADEIIESSNSAEQNLTKMFNESNKRLEDITTGTSNEISSMVEKMEDVFQQKVTQLDDLLNQELEKSLSSLGRQLVTVSERFVQDYGSLADKLQLLSELSKGRN